LDEFPVRAGLGRHRGDLLVSAREDAGLSGKIVGERYEHLVWRDVEIVNPPADKLYHYLRKRSLGP
jgi:hypothetical protein